MPHQESVDAQPKDLSAIGLYVYKVIKPGIFVVTCIFWQMSACGPLVAEACQLT